MKDMVIVKQPQLSVFCGPSESSERTDELLYGMWGQLMGEHKDGFVHICTGYGYEGWCRADGLTFGEWDVCRAWCSSRAFVLAEFADVLSEPSAKAQVLMTLPRGSLVTVWGDKRNDGWVSVELMDKRKGYLRTGQISRVRTGKRDGYWSFSPLTLPADREEQVRKGLVKTALSFLGTPYRWGGKSPEGIDCSGFCSLVYWLHGIVIYRDSSMPEEYAVRKISESDLKPGDLMYFPGHMAMYIGRQKFIHSSFSRMGVLISSLCPGEEDYFPELDGKLQFCGSVFCRKQA